MKDINKGVILMLISSLCYALMGAFAKKLSADISSLEVVFFKNIIGVFLVGITLFKLPLVNSGSRPILLFFRGAMGFAALLAFFYTIANLPLADAMILVKTSPIFVAVFAFLFLREKLGIKGWVAVFIGFIGMIFVVQPEGFSLNKVQIIGIFSGVGAGLAYTSIRELKRHYDTRAIVLSMSLIGTIAPAVLMSVAYIYEPSGYDFLFAKFVMPGLDEWLSIFGMGLFATLSQIFMTRAYGLTRAGIVGAVSYMSVFFSMLLGFILGDALSDIWKILGIILIVIGGILVAKEK